MLWHFIFFFTMPEDGVLCFMDTSHSNLVSDSVQMSILSLTSWLSSSAVLWVILSFEFIPGHRVYTFQQARLKILVLRLFFDKPGEKCYTRGCLVHLFYDCPMIGEGRPVLTKQLMMLGPQCKCPANSIVRVACHGTTTTLSTTWPEAGRQTYVQHSYPAKWLHLVTVSVLCITTDPHFATIEIWNQGLLC